MPRTYWCASLLLLIIGRVSGVFAQATVPDFTSGFTPYQSYQGGDLDSVNPATGSVNLHIPLVSFPQRGSGLRLNFVINYNSTVTERLRFGTGTNTYYQWSPVDTNSPSVTVVDDQSYAIYEGFACYPQISPPPPCSHPTQQTEYSFYSVTSPDGAQHVMGYTSGGPAQKTGAATLRAMDMTGFYLSIPDVSQPLGINSTIYDESGNRYHGWEGSYTSAWRTDANGNSINRNSSGTYTDTMNRSIPAPPQYSSTNTTDTVGCIGPLPVTKAVLWQLPGYNGQSYPIKFCYASVLINIYDDGYGGQNGGPDGYAGASQVIQSIVLPDAQTLSFSSGTPTAWEFEFNDQDSGGQYGTLSKITLPTGGSISYTYKLNGDSAQIPHRLQRSVSTRTLSDGSTSNAWTYTYTAPAFPSWVGSTVMTAPKLPYDSQPNDTVYTVVGQANAFDANFVNQIDSYEGSHSSGTRLKSVAKAITFYANPYYSVGGGVPGFGGRNAGQLLNSETTTLTNNTVAQTSYYYDSGFSINGLTGSACCTFYYGVQTNVTNSDYGSGAPGALLRQALNTYKWQTDSNTLNANLLELKASQVIENGSGTKCAETDYTYDNSSRLFSSGITTQHGSPSVARGNLSSIIRQLSTTPCVSSATWTPITSYTNVYDTGTLYQSIDPLNNITTHTYSSTFVGSYVTQTQSPTTGSVQHIVSGNYDFNTGLLTSFTDENSQPTTYGYDYSRRMTSAVFPTGGGQTTISYTDALGALQGVLQEQQTSSTWIKRTETLDGLGRVLQAQLNSDVPSTTYTQTNYDVVGRKYQSYNPTRCSPPTTNCGESTWGYTTDNYDALNRVTTIVEQDGSTAGTSYSGNCTTVTDEAGKVRSSCADGLGRPTGVWEDPGSSPHLNYETDYSYDPLGNLLTVNQKGNDPNSANWRTRTFAYDSFSRLLSATNPESGNISYIYDNDGNVMSKTSPAPNQTNPAVHQTVSYCYDALNRPTSKWYTTPTCANSSPVANYFYDQTAYNGLTITNGIGRRTGMSDLSGANAWSYDSTGRVLTVRQTNNSVTQNVSYNYNLDGSMGTVTYPSGRVITYGYSAAARPLSAVDSGNGINYVTAATYAPQGALATLSNGSSIAGALSYNNRLQPLQIYYTTGTIASNTLTQLQGSTCPTTTATIMSTDYNFSLGANDNGNVQSITNCRNTNRTQNFTYDAVNRIQTAYSTGPNWGEAYGSTTAPGGVPTTAGIDAWGNLWQRSAITGKTNYESLNAPANSGTNQLTGFSYDAAGNMTANGMASFTYDAENHLINTSGYTYTYDGDGKRVKKSSGSTGMLYWTGMGSDAMAESNLSGTMQEEYIFFGGRRMARRDVSNGAVHYYFSDHLGSHGVVENAAGTTCEQDIDYYPFGGVEQDYCPTVSQNYKFTGKERDAETGLDNFGARYDASSLGRFMTPDWAAKPTTVPYALFGDPQTLNLYAYVRNNPVSRADLDGHCADHYKDGTCKVNVDSATGQAGAKAGKQLEGVLNKYDKAVNALNDKDKFNIKDSNGKVIGSMTGKEIKAVWNGTSFDVTNKSFNNGGAGGGTSGTWNGDSFSGRSELTPGAVSAYANAASARNEAPVVGLNSLTFHELAHETHFGEALTNQYPVTPTLSWPREQGTSSAGRRMSDAVGAPFDCSIPGGCQ